MDIDGRKIALLGRWQEMEGSGALAGDSQAGEKAGKQSPRRAAKRMPGKEYAGLLWEKDPYRFQNYRKGGTSSIFFPGRCCAQHSFPAFISGQMLPQPPVLPLHLYLYRSFLLPPGPRNHPVNTRDQRIKNQTASNPARMARTLASLNFASPLSANILHIACSA